MFKGLIYSLSQPHIVSNPTRSSLTDITNPKFNHFTHASALALLLLYRENCFHFTILFSQVQIRFMKRSELNSHSCVFLYSLKFVYTTDFLLVLRFGAQTGSNTFSVRLVKKRCIAAPQNMWLTNSGGWSNLLSH